MIFCRRIDCHGYADCKIFAYVEHHIQVEIDQIDTNEQFLFVRSPDL